MNDGTHKSGKGGAEVYVCTCTCIVHQADQGKQIMKWKEESGQEIRSYLEEKRMDRRLGCGR